MARDEGNGAGELTAELITGMFTPGDPRVSPDGRLVAFTVTAASKEKGKMRLPSAVWVVAADGSAPARRWTAAGSSAHSPRWSPDGRFLAVLSDRAEEGRDQVYRLPVTGGEAEAVTDWKGGVSAFAWSPDGSAIAFTAADESWHEETKRREETGEDGEAWMERPGHHRLRVVPAGGGAVATLGPADRHVTAFAWAPSGREIAAALAPRPDLDAPAEAGVDLVRLTVGGGAPRTVCHVPFGAGHLTWTADGAALLFIAWEALAIPSSMAAFAVAAGGGTPRCLTAGMDGCALALSRAGESPWVLCAVAEGLITRVYELDPATGKRTHVHTPPRGAATGEFSTDAAGRTLALVCSAGDAPPEVWCGAPETGLRRLSDCNPALAGIAWAVQEPFLWTAPDGWSIDGLVLRPPRAERLPPGVVLVHGGPYGRYLDGFNCTRTNWTQWLALAGYAVLLPNPRGGSGHGHRFAATVTGEVGMADWLDVAAGADAFVERGLADGERLGIGGWSQGGFMTAWAISGGIPAGIEQRGWDEGYATWQSVPGERFRAGIDGAGPTDWGAMVSESDMPVFEAMLGGSRPGDGLGPLRHHLVSPISYAARVRTPLLILHGRNDERVPAGQATGFFRELRRRGVPAEMVVYPREPHGIEESAHQQDVLRRVRDWFGRWLNGGSR